MSQVEEAKFSCKNCGKSYKWKPEFAGRKVKCKCGYVMTAPAAPPASDEPYIYLPLGLLLFGLVISVLQHTRFDTHVFPLSQAITLAAGEFVISMVLLAIWCLIMMRVAEIAFGSPGPAALKIAAIAIAPAA